MKWEEIEKKLGDHVRTTEDSCFTGDTDPLVRQHIWKRIKDMEVPAIHHGKNTEQQIRICWRMAASVFLILALSAGFFWIGTRKRDAEIVKLEAEVLGLKKSEVLLTSMVLTLQDSLSLTWQDRMVPGFAETSMAEVSIAPRTGTGMTTARSGAEELVPGNSVSAEPGVDRNTMEGTGRNELPLSVSLAEKPIGTDELRGSQQGSADAHKEQSMLPMAGNEDREETLSAEGKEINGMEGIDPPGTASGEEFDVRFDESDMALISDELQKAPKKGLVRYKILYSDINTNTNMQPRSWELTITYQ